MEVESTRVESVRGCNFNNLAFFFIVINNTEWSKTLRRSFGFGIVRCLIIMGFDMTSINLILFFFIWDSTLVVSFPSSFLSPYRANSRIQLIILTTWLRWRFALDCKEVIARLREKRRKTERETDVSKLIVCALNWQIFWWWIKIY